MNGDGALTSEASADRRAARKPRPEIQIYRPGALRKGDSTKSLANEDRPPRPERLQTEPTSSSSSSSRRRSNDTDSVTSRGGSGSTTPDANVINERGKNRFKAPSQQGYTYNSTQSLYDTRRQGGYTEYNGNRSNRNEGGGGGGRGGRYQNSQHQNQHRQPFERAGNHSRGFNERASMRGDGAIAKRPSGGRRRNDSINSTQSEMPPSTADQLHIDTTYDSVSQCGASSAFSMNSLGEAFSFEEMCQNLQSFASMDWSKEVENEFAMQEEEEQKRKEEEQKPPPPVVEKKKNGRLQEANGQSQRRPRNRRNRRNDESDRESSFGGSIAEEEEEEEELRSGERTPTSSRASIQPYNPRTMYQKTQKGPPTNNENNGYNRRPNYNHNVSNSNLYSESAAEIPQKKAERRGGYRGEHDDRDADDTVYDGVEHHMTSGRLAGRISIVRREMPNEEKNRPRQKAQAQADELTKTIQKRSESPEMPSREVLNKRRKEQIAENEGPRIKELTEEMKKLSVAVKSRNVKAAEKVVQLSQELANIYSSVILADVVYACMEFLESKVFRSCFYQNFQFMRSASNSPAIESKLIRGETSKMLSNGIAFYEQLIQSYETKYNILLEDALAWKSGAPTDNQLIKETIVLPCGHGQYHGDHKIVIKSLAVHLVNLGDLHRYKTLIDGSENYDNAKNTYLKSTLLAPHHGRAYNQISHVAYYAERVIDELFFLARALSCQFFFELSKDRLNERLDAMRIKVAAYQPKLDEEFGVVTKNADAAKKVLRAILELQIYVHPVTNVTTSTTGERMADDILSDIKRQPKDQTHRRAVSYLCYTFGLLVTKIGMEQFLSVSDRAFGLLYASLSDEETDFQSLQLVKLAAMFIYAVQVNVKKPDNAEMIRVSINTLMTYFMLLVDIFVGIKSETIDYSHHERFLLPAINTLATWICHPDTRSLLKANPRISTLTSTILTHVSLAEVLEKVKEVEPKLRKRCGELEDSHIVTYPEYVLLASFFNFDTIPDFSRQSTKVGIEFGRILIMLEAVDVVRENAAILKDKDGQNPDEEPEESPRTREVILEAEKNKGNRVLVVRPEHLIPDTNVLIGNLRLVKQLMASKKFNILLPIRVKDELVALSRPPKPSQRTVGDGDHDPERGSKAKVALEWLQKEFQAKNDRLCTLTSQGSRVYGMGNENAEYLEEMNNDDIILNGAVKYASTLSPCHSQFDKVVETVLNDYPPESIHRKTCVLLTGDRGLTIKSIDRNLPCRSIEDFAEWFGRAEQ